MAFIGPSQSAHIAGTHHDEPEFDVSVVPYVAPPGSTPTSPMNEPHTGDNIWPNEPPTITDIGIPVPPWAVSYRGAKHPTFAITRVFCHITLAESLRVPHMIGIHLACVLVVYATPVNDGDPLAATISHEFWIDRPED